LDSVVVVAVLAAALMHASWNALIRIEGDRFSSILLLSATQSAISILLFPFFPAPAAAAWPWLVASSALHVGYKLFLTKAYSHGDLAQVYPLARGSAPLIVAIVGALFLHEEIGFAKAAAVVSIGCGVIVMSLRGGADLGRLSPHALGYALGTACFTAAYTIVDAIGARLSHSASAYTLGMFALDGASMVALGLFSRGASVFPKNLAPWRTGALAGALSLGSYWVAIWAFTQAPVALVAALRETSVLMAMLIGVFLLKEPGGRWRWGAAGLIVFGVVLMRV
jgi:drug/metabolite transporter (DMT)-like permease